MEPSYHRCKKGTYAIMKCRRPELIIVDDTGPGAPDNDHSRTNARVRNFFREHTNCRISRFNLRPGWTIADWNDWWANRLRQKRKGDLMVIFFHGQAAANGHAYEWRISSNPAQPINAYSLIERVNTTQVDCLFIVDAWLPNTIKDYFEQDQRLYGITDLIARGEEERDLDGNLVHPSGTFTKAMIDSFEIYLSIVTGHKDPEKGTSQRYYKREPMSILEIMGGTKLLTNKAHHPFLIKPGWPFTELILRLKFVPWAVKNTGKLEFHTQQMQPMTVRNEGYGKITRRTQRGHFEVESGAPVSSNEVRRLDDDDPADEAPPMDEEGFEWDVVEPEEEMEDVGGDDVYHKAGDEFGNVADNAANNDEDNGAEDAADRASENATEDTAQHVADEPMDEDEENSMFVPM